MQRALDWHHNDYNHYYKYYCPHFFYTVFVKGAAAVLLAFFHLHIRSVDLMKHAISNGESGARIPQDPCTWPSAPALVNQPSLNTFCKRDYDFPKPLSRAVEPIDHIQSVGRFVEFSLE